ncbi:MAG: hypothetical protein ACXWUG_20155 [Polyangiales bacterium]
MRRVLGFALASALLFASPIVRAQSASELIVARQLFAEGQDLEKKKDYAGALEKFRKVATIKSTAIVRYHEGYCAEKIGKWIDALDAYAKAQLEGQGDPKQKEAVEAARKAQEALRPKVPRIKVKVTGQQKGKHEIRIDGVPVSAVLVDLPIPVDPGKHLIEVLGEGQTAEGQEVTVGEKETKELSFELKDASSVPKKEEPKKEQPKKEEPKKEEPPKKEPKKKDGFALVFGLQLGNIMPGGKFVDPSTVNAPFVAVDGNSDQLQYVGSGFMLEPQVGIRPLPWLGVYAFWQHGFLAKSGNTKDATDFSASTDLVGIGGQILTHPHSMFSGYGDLSFGPRVTKLHSGDVDGSFSAIDGRIKIGAAYRPRPDITVLAFVWASVGTYTHFKFENAANADQNRDEAVDATASHSFIGFGLGGQYDLKL